MDTLTKFCNSLRKYMLDKVDDDSTVYSQSTRVRSIKMAACSEQEILWENMGILHLAIQDSDINVIKEFMKGSDWPQLQGHDQQGRTILHWAMVFGNNEVARLILTHPTTTKQVVNFHDKRGRTALHYAAMAGRNDLVNILFMKGAKINGKDRQGMTPLHYAAQNANPFVIHTLLYRGAEKSMMDKSSRLPYHTALIWKSSPEVVHALDPDLPNDQHCKHNRVSLESSPEPISYYDQDLTKDAMLTRFPSFLSTLLGRKPKSPFNVAKIPLRLLGIVSQKSVQRCARRPMPNPGEQLVEAVKLEMEKNAQKFQAALLKKFHVGSLERFNVMNAVSQKEAEMRQDALKALIMRHNKRVQERRIARERETARLKVIDTHRYRIPQPQPKGKPVSLRLIRHRASQGQKFLKDYDSKGLTDQIDRLNQKIAEAPVSPTSDNTGKIACDQGFLVATALQHIPHRSHSQDGDHWHRIHGLKQKDQFNQFAQDDIGIRYPSHTTWDQRPDSSPVKVQLQRLNQFRPQGDHFSHDQQNKTLGKGYHSDSSPTLRRMKKNKVWQTHFRTPYSQSEASSNQLSQDSFPHVKQAVNYKIPFPSQRQEPKVARLVPSTGEQWGLLPGSTQEKDQLPTSIPHQVHTQQQLPYHPPAYQQAWKVITSQSQKMLRASSPCSQQQSWRACPLPYQQAMQSNRSILTPYKYSRSKNYQNAYSSPSPSSFDNNSQQSQRTPNCNVFSPYNRRQSMNSNKPIHQLHRPFKGQLQPFCDRPLQIYPPHNIKRGNFQNQYGGPGPVTPELPSKDHYLNQNPMKEYSREIFDSGHYQICRDFRSSPRTSLQFQTTTKVPLWTPRFWSPPTTRRPPPLGLVEWATRAFPNLVGKNKLVPSLEKPGHGTSCATTRGYNRGYYGIRDRRKKKKVRKKFKYFFFKNAKRPIAPARRALTEFVGTADRCNYVNTSKIRVHQCLDLETLHKQWL